MATLTPDRPQFRPYADYQNTLASFGLAMRGPHVFEAGDGTRIAAGRMLAPTDSATPGAHTLELVVVESTGDPDDSGQQPLVYRYQLQPYNEHEVQIGSPRTGIFMTNFSGSDVARHTKMEGERVRDWLTGVQFSLEAAMLAAPDQVHTAIVLEAAIADDALAEATARRMRRARAARWLGWLGSWNPLR